MTERRIEDYQDMIHLPHHISEHRPHMSMTDRAAQFSPFAALTGYGAAVKETERITDRRIEIDEDTQQKISERLTLLQSGLSDSPVEITYFIPDEKKAGGRYITVTDGVKKLDEYQRLIIMTDGTKIPIEDIADVNGAMFQSIDDSFA